jgi:hypothetical protein
MARVVIVGDSVHWGQGLRDENKFRAMLESSLGDVDLLAHSGAIIGAHMNPDPAEVDGEVPFPTPTVYQQCLSHGDPGSVDILVLNGGINDVDVRNIISPLTRPSVLSQRIEQYCKRDMKWLVDRAGERFPRARLLVTSYFPIFSTQSDPLGIHRILAAHCIFPPPVLMTSAGLVRFEPALHNQLIESKVVKLALQFWHESSAALRAAAASANASGPAAGRVSFVEVPYTEDNAMYADRPLLFQLDERFLPDDEVFEPRRSACRAVHADDPFAAWACSIAAVGHPNVPGARLYGETVLQCAGIPT